MVKKKKPYKANQKKTVAVAEPKAEYNTVRMYHSFEEAEEGEIKQILKQAPVERLKQTIELILRAYGVTREDLSKRKMSNKLIFGNRE